MQRPWSAIIGYAIITLCSVIQLASESKAENQTFPEGLIVIADSAAAVSPLWEEILLVKSEKDGVAWEEKESWTRVGGAVASGVEQTKVKVKGSSVFVPATLVFRRNKVDVCLLLDTGATGTAINTEIADQLSINLNQARKTQVQVVGGGLLKVSVIRIDRLIVGPHTIPNLDIFVVPHEDPVTRCDGLLGMDVLRGLKYEVDFKKQVIIWE